MRLSPKRCVIPAQAGTQLMAATFSATVMVHSCVGVGLTAGHFVPRLRGNDEELGNSDDNCGIDRNYRFSGFRKAGYMARLPLMVLTLRNASDASRFSA
jgi:hypothetical protein